MKKIFTLIAALTLSVGLWAQTAGTTIIVHNLTGWDNLYLYMWGEGGNDLVGAWPGMTAQRVDEGNPIFLVTEGEYDGKSENLIFNNGNGVQLSDYPITLGGTYELWVILDANGVFDAQFVDATSGLKFEITAVGETNTVKVIENNYTGTSYTIPATVNYNYVDFAVTEIGTRAFDNCESLQSITIPDGVITIGEYAFEGCSALQSITIPAGVTEIGAGAFAASGLQTITIPAGVTEIQTGAFYECTGLTSVTFLGNACQDAIGGHAFDGVGDPDPALLTLPNSWTGTKPDEDGNWYGGKFELSEDPAPAPEATIEIKDAEFYCCDAENNRKEFYGGNEDYNFDLFVQTATVKGDFKDAVDLTDSCIKTSDGTTTTINLLEVYSFSVTGVGKDLTLTASVLGSDNNQYDISATGYDGYIQGDAVDGCDIEFAADEISVQQIKIGEVNYISIQGESAAGDKMEIAVKGELNDGKLAAGTYADVAASTGWTDDYTLTPSYIGNNFGVWFIQSGTLTVAADGSMKFVGVNSHDASVEITIPASGPTVDETGITVNGRKYGFPVRLVKEVPTN